MNLIPDPIDARAPAIVSDENGTRLAPVVMFAPVGTDPSDAPAWKPGGWLTRPMEITGILSLPDDDFRLYRGEPD